MKKKNMFILGLFHPHGPTPFKVWIMSIKMF